MSATFLWDDDFGSATHSQFHHVSLPFARDRSDWRPPIWWQDLQQGLERALEAMREDEFLIILVKGSNRCVQFAAQGASGMRVEASSNHFLHGEDRLSDAQQVQLEELGWNAPTGTPQEATPERQPMGSPNHFVDCPLPIQGPAIVELALRTLIDVFEVSHPHDLRYQAFDRDGDHYPLPELPILHSLRDVSARMTDVAEKLLNTFRALISDPSLEFDSKGRFWIALKEVHKEIPTRIWLTQQPMLVHFSYPIMVVEEDRELMLRIFNDLNIKHELLRFTLEDELGWVSMEVFAEPFVAEQVVTGFRYFTWIIKNFLDLMLAAPLTDATH